MKISLTALAIAICLTARSFTAAAAADSEGADHKIKLADGNLQLQAPDAWKRTKPKTSIIEHEFAVPHAEGDAADGRLTIMSAGGSVDDNINRWIGQFSQPDGGNTKERAKVKQSKVAGQEVHLVDISGTFKDQPGPLAPPVERPKYRMIAAIIRTPKQGNYFIKFYGPEKTIADNEKAFGKMIEDLSAK